jgi:tetratricopeptide (TPR) repeat protein
MRRSALVFVLTLAVPAAIPAQASNATLRQALQAYDSLDYARAIVLARRALGERLNGPEQGRAYELLGFAYAVSDSQAKAVDAFKQVILLDPDHQLDANKVSPKITSLFYSALGQVLVVRQLRVDSATFVSGQGAVPIRFTVTSPARVRVRAVSGASSLLVDSMVATGAVSLRWPARLPSGDPVSPGPWLLVVDATAGQNTFSASQPLRIGRSPVDTVAHLTSLPGYKELPEMETPPQSWRPLGLAFLFATGTAAGTFALNNGGLGSTPGRELAGVSIATLATGLVMTLRKPAPRRAEANILYNRLLHEQLARRNADIAQENAKRRQQVALTIVPLPKAGGGR